MIGAILGCLCAAVAAVLLYLAAPHQKWGALPCPVSYTHLTLPTIYPV